MKPVETKKNWKWMKIIKNNLLPEASQEQKKSGDSSCSSHKIDFVKET